MNLNIDTCKIIDIHVASEILQRTERQIKNYVKNGQLEPLLKKGPFFKRVYLFDRDKVFELKANLNENVRTH